MPQYLNPNNKFMISITFKFYDNTIMQKCLIPFPPILFHKKIPPPPPPKKFPQHIDGVEQQPRMSGSSVLQESEISIIILQFSIANK